MDHIFNHHNLPAHFTIYNSMGILMKEIKLSQSTGVNISDFSAGIYFIGLNNQSC
jgi:hypothetical protein